MQNLQKLFNYYRDTNPSSGKLNSAASLLIHVCTALNVKNPEDIHDYLLEDIPAALDEHFKGNRDKAIQDKSILAEMIGRFGPKEGWQVTLDILLRDTDSNLRQFALQSLEYCGNSEPELILPYIEKYSKSKDPLLRNISALLVSRIFCTSGRDFLKPVIAKWKLDKNTLFIREIITNIDELNHSTNSDSAEASCRQFKTWLQKEFNISTSSS